MRFKFSTPGWPGIAIPRNRSGIFLPFSPLILLLCFSFTAAHGQAILNDHYTEAVWANDVDGSGDQIFRDVFIGTDNHPVMVGELNSDADLPNGASLTQVGNNPNFLMVKYDSSGTVDWAKNFGGLSGNASAYAVAVDTSNSNRIYAGGDYSNVVDFTPGSTSPLPNTLGDVDGWVVRYDENGNYDNFAIGVGGDQNGSGEPARIRDIVVAPDGDVIIVGTYTRAARINTSQTTNAFVLFSGLLNGAEEAFVARFKPDATLEWVVEGIGDRKDAIEGVTVDSAGNVIVVGSYEDNFLLGTTNFPINPSNFALASAFVAKFSPTGTLLWHDIVPGTTGSFVFGLFSNSSANEMNAVVTDDSANIYIAGAFMGTAIFGAGQANEQQLGADDQKDIFLVKYDPNGNVRWAKDGRGPGMNLATGVAITNDHVYLSGRYGDALGGQPFKRLRFDSQGENDFTILSNGDDDAVVAAFTLDGEFAQVSGYGGLLNDRIWALAAYEGRIFGAGEYLSDSFFVKRNKKGPSEDNGGGINALAIAFELDTAMVVHVLETGTVGEAEFIQVWGRDMDDQTSGFIKEIDPVTRKVVFYKSDIVRVGEVEDLYAMKKVGNDTLPMGRVVFKFPKNNWQADRRKELFMVIHNDLVTYQDHWYASSQTCWNMANRWHYKYQEESSVEDPGDPLPANSEYYQTTMLIPPRDSGDFRFDEIRPDKTPIIYVHGYDGTEGKYWAGNSVTQFQWHKPYEGENPLQNTAIAYNNDVLKPEDALNANFPAGVVDYVYTSYPGRTQIITRDDFDVWEYYWPPDQSYEEAGYLMGQAMQHIRQTYPGKNLNFVCHSMGGLVTRSWVEGQNRNWLKGSPFTPVTYPFVDNSVECVVMIGTPQHGSLLANKSFYNIGFPQLPTVTERIASGLANKDPCGMMNFSAGPGSDALERMNRKDNFSTHGAGYLQLQGTSFVGVFPRDPFLPNAVFLRIDESRYSEDGVTSMISGSLLNFGVDLGLLTDYNHSDETNADNQVNPVDRNLIPDIVADFVPDGSLGTGTKSRLLRYYDGSLDPEVTPVITPADGVIPIGQGPQLTPVYQNITMPMISFSRSNGGLWVPNLNMGFKAEYENDSTLALERSYPGVGLPFSFLRKEGMYIYWGQIDHSKIESKKLLTRRSSLFYGFERTNVFPNPLVTDAQQSFYENLRPQPAGLGWYSPQAEVVKRNVVMKYATYEIEFDERRYRKQLTGWFYHRATDPGDPLVLRWLSPTYKTLKLDAGSLQLVSSHQMLTAPLPGALSAADFQGGAPVPPGFSSQALTSAPSMPSGTTDSTRMWIDPLTTSASFVLKWVDGATPQPISLLSPGGDIITPADSNGIDTLYTDKPDFNIRWFSIENPEPGPWFLLVNGQKTNPNANEYSVSFASALTNELVLEPDSTPVANDTGFVVRAKLEIDSIPTSNVQVNAYQYSESDSFRTLTMTDDGNYPDAQAGDGIFTGIASRVDTTEHTIVVSMWGKMGAGGDNFVRQTGTNLPPCDFDVIAEADKQLACTDDTIAFSMANLEEQFSYIRWDFGDGSTDSVANPEHVYTTAGNYTVVLKAFTFDGCVDTTQINVTIFSGGAISLIVNGVPEFCPGDSVILDAGPGESYLWSNGDTTQTVAVSTADSFYCTVTFPGGCVGMSDTVIVTESTPPVVNLTLDGPVEFCEGDTLNIDAGAGFTSYLWSNGATTQSIDVTLGGFYDVTVTNAAGCADTSSTVVVSVNANPVPTITPDGGNTEICDGESLQLDAGSGFVSYLWSTGATTQTIDVTVAGTYAVTVTNLDGCSGSNSETITVIPAPVVNVSPSGPTTFCDGGSVTLTASGSGPWDWSNGASSQSIVVTTSGTYDVSVTSEQGCEGSSTPVVVTVNANPTPVIAASGPLDLCPGSTVVLDAGTFSSYAWSNGATTQSITVSAGGNYSVTVTDTNGCSGIATPVTVTNLPGPNPVISASGPTVFCDGGSVTLDAGSGFNSYAWSTGATTQTINVTGSGTYTVTVTDGSACTGIAAPVVVTVNPNPTPVISPSGPTTFCDGGSVTLDAGAGFSNYSWSNGATTQTITVSAAGSFDVTVTDGNGCIGSSAAVAVTVNPNPTPVIVASGPLALCPGSTVVLDAGAGFNSYAWSNGATTQTITVSAGGTYSVTVTDANACSGISSPVTVTNLPGPTPVISASGPTTFCDGGSVTLDAGAGFNTYTWSTGATTQTINVTSSGSYTVTVTDGSACTGIATPVVVTVNANPTPVISPSGPTTFCDGGSVTLDAGAGFSAYNWSNGATTQTITVTASGSFDMTVTDGNGCVGNAAAVAVTVNPNPTVSITPSGPITFCDGGNVTLDAGAGFSSYAWSNGATTQSITVSVAGNYDVTVTDGNGCSAIAASVGVTVLTATQPVISASGPTTFCDGGSVTLDAGAGFSTYLWSNGATTQTITVSASGSFTVTTTGGNGCPATSAAVSVTVNPNPTPSITPSGPTTFCDGGNVTLDAGAGFSSYAWSNGATTQTITVSASGSFDVTVTDGNGCVGAASALSVTVNPNPAPSISASGPTTFCDGGSVTLDAGAGFNSYLWSTGATTQTITVGAGGSYSVTVSDGNGCSGASAAVAVTVNPNPNPVITPSGPTTFCDGGSVDLDAGAGFSSYAWSNGSTSQSITVTASGSFDVTVTDGNGCVGVSSVVMVTENANPNPVITANGPTTFCDGDNVILDAGAGFSSYAWSNGATTQTITVSAAGNYAVTVTDGNGCTGAATPVAVTVNSNPVVAITASGPLTFPQGGSVTLDAGAGFSSYLWSNGATAQTITVTTSGNFSVTVTDANGCTANDGPVVVTVTQQGVTLIKSGDLGCTGNTVVTLTATPGFARYDWSIGLQNGPSTITTSLTGTYDVTVTNSQGQQFVSNPVTVDYVIPNAVIFATFPTDTCPGDTFTFFGLPNDSLVSDVWDFGQGAVPATATGPGPHKVVYPPGSGSGTRTVNHTASLGVCSSIHDVYVDLNPFCTLTQPLLAVLPAYCDKNRITNLATTIYCDPLPLSSLPCPGGNCNYTIQYEFIFINRQNPQQTFNVLSNPGENFINLENVSDVNYRTRWRILVRPVVDGVAGETGSSCNLTVIAIPAPVVIDPAGLCGSPKPEIALDDSLTCTYVGGASQYQWVFTDPASLATITYNSTSNSILLGDVTGLQANRFYTLEIRAQVGNSWGRYSSPCTLAVVCAGCKTNQASAPASAFEDRFEAFPNPVTDGQLNLRVELANEEEMEILLYDVRGKLVRTLHKGELQRFERAITLNEEPAGIYMVLFRMKDRTVTRRFQLQH